MKNNEVLDNFNFELEYGWLKNKYFKISKKYKDEIESRIEAKVNTNETYRLKEEC